MHRLACLYLVCLLSTGCTRYYYRPNAVEAPLFTGGGQAHFDLAGSTGNFYDQTNGGNTYDGSTTTFAAQAAYSPINHLAAFFSYSSLAYRTANPDNAGNVDANAHLLEGAIGGYYAKGRKFKMVADLYVGYGGGPIRSDVDMHLSRFFVQPGIGVTSPYFDAAFNLRISAVNFSRFNANGHDSTYLQNNNLIDGLGTRIDQRGYAFAEPCFTVRGGYKFLKIQMQIVVAQSLDNAAWNYNPVTYTLGVYFSLEDVLKAGR